MPNRQRKDRGRRRKLEIPAVLMDRGPDQAAMRRAAEGFWNGDLDAMACAIGRSRSTVHHWLTGRNGCSTDELALVAHAAGVPLEAVRYGADVILLPPTTPGEAPRVLRPGDPGYERIRGFADAVLEDDAGPPVGPHAVD